MNDSGGGNPPTILLIGPYLCGKTTLRLRLAERLGLPHCSLNPGENWDLCHSYYREIGYDDKTAEAEFERHGYERQYRFLKPFEAHAVARCLQDHPGHIIEIGATLSVQEDDSLFRSVKHAAAGCEHVFLLLPSADPARSFEVLRERVAAALGLNVAEHFVKHHSNHDLATHTVYTGGRTPEETCDEIVGLIGEDGQRGPIVLIGPQNAGKTTIARLLTARLGRPHASMDAARWEYYAEWGYDSRLAEEIRQHLGFGGLYRYWKPFEAYAVERIIADHPSAIIDFGAGHSVFEDDALFARVQRALATVPHVILLLPSPDLDESVRILNERSAWLVDGADVNQHLIQHHSNQDLATAVFYTEGKGPDGTLDEILAQISR